MIANLVPFLIESFKIEGILRPPFPDEITATEKFLMLPRLAIEDVSALVTAYQPKAVIRDQKGMNVRVGNHIPPPGGPSIPRGLKMLLEHVNKRRNVWQNHIYYEILHPFTDGNGRSGRAIWAWQMIRERGDHEGLQLLFLHRFYYQTLENSR